MRARLALVLLAFSAAVPAQQLGTLFLSAKERELLDRQRRGDRIETDGQAVVARPDPVITGYVKRSDGKSTAFVDKQPVPVRNPRLERRLEPRAVDRFDPLPMPVEPEPAAKAAESAEPAKPSATSAAAPAKRSQPGKEE